MTGASVSSTEALNQITRATALEVGNIRKASSVNLNLGKTSMRTTAMKQWSCFAGDRTGFPKHSQYHSLTFFFRMSLLLDGGLTFRNVAAQNSVGFRILLRPWHSMRSWMVMQAYLAAISSMPYLARAAESMFIIQTGSWRGGRTLFFAFCRAFALAGGSSKP